MKTYFLTPLLILTIDSWFDCLWQERPACPSGQLTNLKKIPLTLNRPK